jgi:hypothetical protein
MSKVTVMDARVDLAEDQLTDAEVAECYSYADSLNEIVAPDGY